MEGQKNSDAGPRKVKLLLIGIDGASPQLVEKWMQDGSLPNLKKMSENGVYSRMRTTVPSITSPAMPSMFTGKNPGKHGVFHLTDEFSRPVSLTDVKSDKIWTILSKAGYKCAIINVPITYPPEQLNGIMVSDGVFTPSADSVFYFPPSIKDRLKGYPIIDNIPETSRGLDLDEFVKGQKQTTEKRFDFVESVMHEGFDLVFYFEKGTDVMQHLFWDKEEYILDFYKLVDARIGRLSELAYDVVVFSDHGFDPGPTRNFHINTWLQERGFLKTTKRAEGMMGISKILPQSAKKFGLRLLKAIKGDTDFKELIGIDVKSSKAYSSRWWGIEINRKAFLNDREAMDFKEKLMAELRGLKDSAFNEPVFQEVAARESVYTGQFTSRAPEIILLPSKGYFLKVALSENMFTVSKRELTGNHMGSVQGIFLATGHIVGGKKEAVKDGVNIVDIAPTLMDAFKIKAPEDVDGKVLKLFSG